MAQGTFEITACDIHGNYRQNDSAPDIITRTHVNFGFGLR